MKQIDGGICAPQGFLANGIFSGVKRSGKKDLALIASECPATLAALFTQNHFPAAPIVISRQNARGNLAQAIIANSGNANCATGAQGLRDARIMVKETAAALGVPAKYVLVTSTGSIGKPMKMECVVPGIHQLANLLTADGGGNAADAILTTDTCRKEIAYEVAVGKHKFRIAGIAKGSGMIHPNMATMHAFITTDAVISPWLLKKLLKAAVDESFNMVTVDREMSTNDCVFALANGRSGVKVGGLVGDGKIAEVKFARALRAVCLHLAKEIARDGEGATKLVEVTVKGAQTLKAARQAARHIAGSDLVATALFGEDPNFGRALAALGAAGVHFDPNRVDLKIQHVSLVRNGFGLVDNMDKAARRLKAKEVYIEVNLNQGKYSAISWGSDLTYGYIKINAKYHT